MERKDLTCKRISPIKEKTLTIINFMEYIGKQYIEAKEV